MVENAVGVDDKTYCAVHPTIETGLRCNRCGRYMCTRCAVLTPVGYRCRECVRGQQDAFYKATERDYLVAAGVALALSIPIGFVMARLFLLLVLILSIPVGALIGEVMFRAAGRRKGRYFPHVAVGCIVAGAIIGALPVFQIVIELLGRTRGAPSSGGVVGLLINGLLPTVLYVALSAFAAVGRVR